MRFEGPTLAREGLAAWSDRGRPWLGTVEAALHPAIASLSEDASLCG